MIWIWPGLAMTPRRPAQCPRGGEPEDRLVEYDVVRGRFYCSVCAASWLGRV